MVFLSTAFNLDFPELNFLFETETETCFLVFLRVTPFALRTLSTFPRRRFFPVPFADFTFPRPAATVFLIPDATLLFSRRRAVILALRNNAAKINLGPDLAFPTLVVLTVP